jgi:putative ABC transport system permease protein
MINNWLRGFAYHVNIGWTIFVVASLSALVVAWMTASYESTKAALQNSVKNLRAE